MESFFKFIKFKKVIFLFLFFILSYVFLLRIFNPNHDFSYLTNRLFLENVTADTLSLHYTLAYPYKYTISSYNITLPEYHKDSLNYSKTKIENNLAALSFIDISSLSSEDLYCYELLKDYFLKQKQGFSFSYFEECFSPNSGIVINFPILMTEYAFRTEQDIKVYLSLLSDTPDYFSDFFSFQEERYQNGYYLSSESLQETLKQCDLILTEQSLNENSHFLQQTFRERVAVLVSRNIITKKKALSYLDENTLLLKTVVFPAYQQLKTKLQSLQTEYVPLQGLYRKDQGKEYYQWLVQNQIGCSLSISEILKKLENDFKKNYFEFQQLQKQISSFDHYEKYLLDSFPILEGEEILKALQKLSSKDFPSFSEYSDRPVFTAIKSVDSSMEEYTSPAFYMIPPIDDIEQNTIYINNKSTPKGLELFTTLAHEGYPGHLYQTVYFQLLSNANHSPLIRHILNYGGYVEGWAIYCELYSYKYATLLYPQKSQNFYTLLHELLACEKKLQLGILSILDIYLHYYDDTLDIAKRILFRYGITDDKIIQDTRRYILEEPGNYLKYYVGYLLFMDLKQKAETLMGSAYTEYRFHEFVLNTGPSDFDNLEKKLLKTYSFPKDAKSYSLSSNIDSK